MGCKVTTSAWISVDHNEVYEPQISSLFVYYPYLSIREFSVSSVLFTYLIIIVFWSQMKGWDASNLLAVYGIRMDHIVSILTEYTNSDMHRPTHLDLALLSFTFDFADWNGSDCWMQFSVLTVASSGLPAFADCLDVLRFLCLEAFVCASS